MARYRGEGVRVAPKATLTDFRAAAEEVRNWGRWGSDDEIGTLNLISDATVRRAVGLVRHGRQFSLGTSFDLDGPQTGHTPIRINPVHFVTIDGGYDDYVGACPEPAPPSLEFVRRMYTDNLFRFNDDFVVMPLQTASQWDALSHVYYEKQMYNGFPSSSVNSHGACRLGIEKVAAKGITARGVLLDVARHRGVPWLRRTMVVEPEELDDVARQQGVEIGPGDVVVIRTGWIEEVQRRRGFVDDAGGLGWRCAQWLHDRDVAAVAADNLAVEGTLAEVEGVSLPLHLLCIRDMGLMLGEIWDLDALAADCAADHAYEFLLVAPPIKVTGGIGSPLNPIAVK